MKKGEVPSGGLQATAHDCGLSPEWQKIIYQRTYTKAKLCAIPYTDTVQQNFHHTRVIGINIREHGSTKNFEILRVVVFFRDWGGSFLKPIVNFSCHF